MYAFHEIKILSTANFQDTSNHHQHGSMDSVYEPYKCKMGPLNKTCCQFTGNTCVQPQMNRPERPKRPSMPCQIALGDSDFSGTNDVIPGHSYPFAGGRTVYNPNGIGQLNNGHNDYYLYCDDKSLAELVPKSRPITIQFAKDGYGVAIPGRYIVRRSICQAAESASSYSQLKCWRFDCYHARNTNETNVSSSSSRRSKQ